MGSSDAMLRGRVTYEEGAAFWPDADNEMADYMNKNAKYVVSTTLEDVDWENSHLPGGDVPTAVAKLKEGPGTDIVISGSPTLVRSLLREGLIDERQLMIYPVVVGDRARLFGAGERHALELANSCQFATGVIHATYRPSAGGTDGAS
jgi:dihydrofolate reductase